MAYKYLFEHVKTLVKAIHWPGSTVISPYNRVSSILVLDLVKLDELD